MFIVRKDELGKYKIINKDGFLSPYNKGEGMYLGRGYYQPERQRGVAYQFRKKGDGIIDTLMGIGSIILKHKDRIGSTASAMGNVAGAIKSIKDAQKESYKLEAFKEIMKGKTKLSPHERKKIIQILGSGFQKFECFLLIKCKYGSN